MLIPNTKPIGKFTISKTDSGFVIRCTGKLTCECGTPVQASDIALLTAPVSEYCDLDNDGDDFDTIVGISLVCPGCHQDLVEVASK
jgi:hypothetical protein